ncbi:hypothetical protein SAMN05216214_10189 [Atopomonas hussainii]|uniref:Beta-ketoadipyl CoA thiolase n=1 Tax=Atopomonas hussainii TaxID=1429083 RepID=A0A1H7FB54_9GAMM|nr:hypothetical protein [Atopomonas hussainii]SEK20445.1 hypothetical protein SAMN05216214_10189 [Atopomonas hussainii]
MTKDQLRAQLEQQAQAFLEKNGAEVVLYAAQMKPDRRAWRRKSSVQEEQFQRELGKMAKDVEKDRDQA